MMEEYEVVQCRSCLCTTAPEFFCMESTMTSRYSYTYLECFNACTQLKADLDDELPGTICVNCAHDLEIAYNFIVVARRADTVLRRELLQEQKSRQNNDELEEVEYISTEGERVKELDLLDESQMEIIQEENYECEELETVEEELALEEIKIEDEMSQSDQFQFQNVKEEKQDLVSSQPNSEDERDDEYLIEYDNANNVDKSTTMIQNNQGSKWKCVECKRILRGDVSYEGHMNMHKNVKPYKCTKCSSAFRCKYALERHVCKRHGDITKKKSTQKAFSCDICGKVCRSSELLHEHQQTECQTQLESCSSDFFEIQDDTSFHMKLMHPPSNIIQIQCAYCTQPPFDKLEILEHVRQEHPTEYSKHMHKSENPDDKSIKSRWQCNICFSNFRSRNLLKDHRSTHGNERPHACLVCAKRFTSTKNMRCHMRTVHQEEFKKYIAEAEEEYVKCHLCNKNLLKKNIEKHLSTHERKEKESTDGTIKYLCAYCPKSFKNKYDVKNHELSHNPSRTRNYSCDYCDMKFFKHYLKMHHIKYVHSIDRRIVCPVCGRTYKEKSTLSTHLKTHDEKRFQCTQCEKKYTRQVDLTVHMRSHTGELPYKCHLCQKRFAIKVRLTYHLQDHVDAEHKCKICGKVFNNRYQLRAHKFEHTGFPYICEECPNGSFYKRDRFRGHIIRHHKRTPSEEELTANFRRNSDKTLY